MDLIENIGSGVLRILDAYDKSCFKFMGHFLRVSFKYKENPFEYDSKNKVSANDTLNDTKKLTENEQQILSLIVSNNQITREECHKQGLWHRAVYAFIIDENKNILLQKRSSNKKLWLFKR